MKQSKYASELRGRPWNPELTLTEINQLNQKSWEIFERIKDRPAAFVPAPGAPAGSQEEMFKMATRIAKSELIRERAEEEEQLTRLAAQLAAPAKPAKKRRRGRSPDEWVRWRRQKIKQVCLTGVKDREYCQRLDNLVLPLPFQWKAQKGCPRTYVEAWDHPNRKWRSLIKNEQRNSLRK